MRKHEAAVCRTARTVVWEVGKREVGGKHFYQRLPPTRLQASLLIVAKPFYACFCTSCVPRRLKLTHKNVTTTQIYADLVNSKKRETANKISLK